MAKKLKIDLSGPDGNAYALMGYARQFSKKMGLDSTVIINEMMSGDYEHLLDVFEIYFGEVATLIRS